MSSWICNPRHFAALQSKLTDMFYQTDNIPYPMRVDYPNLFLNPQKETKKLIDEWAKLNVLCVSYQYAHHTTTLNADIAQEMEIAIKRKPTGAIISSLPALYKALCCLRYQIEIEHLERIRPLTETEAKAWKHLQTLIEFVADKFICSTNEYEKSPWGID